MVHHERVVETFLDITKIDSPTGYESAMAQDILHRLRSICVDANIDHEGNVLATVPGDPQKEPFLLNAHLDTVEPGRGIVPCIDEEGWIRSSGSTILGADNKTAVAAILTVAERIMASDVRTNYPLDLVFTVSEESGNHGAHGLDYGRLRARRGYIFDASDRNFGDMIVSSPYYDRFDVTLTGRPAHASRTEDALNVVPVLAQAILQVPLGPVSDQTRLNIGVIRVGEVVNTIPGSAKLSGEIRSRNPEEATQIAGEFRNIFVREAEQNGIQAQVIFTRENDGFQFDINDPFVQRTLHVLRNFGTNPALIDSWGCYEANIFAAHGILMLNISDGSLDSHTTDERIHVDNLIRLADLAYVLISGK